MKRRLTTEHLLKTWPSPFDAILKGRKTFEFRKDDRGFEVEDILRLEEWSPVTHEYTGRYLKAVVLYIARGGDFGIPDGYCIMSIALLPGEGLGYGHPLEECAP